MNKELNIFTLRMLRDQYHTEHLDTESEALEAAISALEDTDSAYAEGWTAAESKYRAMMSDGDCISRQAAIDALAYLDDYEEQAIETLRKLPSAQPEQQWIPCSERLPEAETMYFRPKHRYLCQRKNEMFVGARFCEPNGMLKEWWDWYGTKIRDEDVIAWMPLPEPWRGEEHEPTMEEFMYGQDMGNPEDGSL